MTLKACCSNIFAIIKRHMWLSAMWFAGLFFCLPVQTAMILQDLRLHAMWVNDYPAKVAEALSRVFGSESIALVCLLMLMAFISALVYGGYMHRPKQVDFYHSQPISRSRLLAQNTAAGLAALFIPYMINLLFTMVLALAMGAGGVFPWGVFFASIAIHTLYFIAIFTTGLIAVVISGKIAVAGITGVFLLSLLPALLGLGLMVIDEFYPAFYSTLYDWNLIVRWLSPAAAYIATPMNGMPHGVLPIIIYDALAFALALLLYHRRGSEVAGQAIAFKAARPVLKYAMACLAASIFALVFHSIGGYSEGNYFWLYFGAFTGGFLATQITEIVYALDFRAIFHHLRGAIIFLAIYVGFFSCVIHDVSGFNKYIPQANQVLSAEIYLPRVNDYVYNGWGYIYGYSGTNKEGKALECKEQDYLAMGPVSSPSAIAAAVNIATLYADKYSPMPSEAQLTRWQQEGKQYLLDYVNDDYDRYTFGYINPNNTSFRIVFTLKNGRKIARDYSNTSIPIQFLLDDISLIYTEENFAAAQLAQLMIADECYVPEQLELFELYYDLPELEWINEVDRSKLLTALRADLLELTVEKQTETMPIGALRLRLYNGPVDYPLNMEWPVESRRPCRIQEWPIYASFTRTLEFFYEAGYEPELFQPQLNDIISLKITDYYNYRYKEKYGYYFTKPDIPTDEYYTDYNEKTRQIEPDREEITDPAYIAEIINQSYPSRAQKFNRFIDIIYSFEADVRYQGPGGIIYTQTRVFPY